jgi:hypothetical protein
MADLKISEMTYKQVTADDQFPTVNSSEPGVNNYGLVGDIPLLVGISPWDSNISYAVEHVVIYNSATTSGMFRVKTVTSPGDAPEGAGFNKFESYAIGWRENAHIATSSSYFLDIQGQRTGIITYNDPVAVNDSILIVLSGDWALAANKNLIVTSNGSNSSGGGESFTVEYINTQINIYCKAAYNYVSGGFKLKFTLHG